MPHCTLRTQLVERMGTKGGAIDGVRLKYGSEFGSSLKRMVAAGSLVRDVMCGLVSAAGDSLQIALSADDAVAVIDASSADLVGMAGVFSRKKVKMQKRPSVWCSRVELVRDVMCGLVSAAGDSLQIALSADDAVWVIDASSADLVGMAGVFSPKNLRMHKRPWVVSSFDVTLHLHCCFVAALPLAALLVASTRGRD